MPSVEIVNCSNHDQGTISGKPNRWETKKGLQVKIDVIFAVSAGGRPKPISRTGYPYWGENIDWRYIVKLIIVLFSEYLI